MSTKVFISAGTPQTPEQQSFLDEVVNSVRQTGLEPRKVGTIEWDPHNPITSMETVMDECAAAIVVAYTRYKVDTGVEVRETGDRDISGSTFPTSWNHIEAAMAIAKRFPVLVIAEHGLKSDTVFETTKDIRPFWTELDPAVVKGDKFCGILNRWRDDVRAATEEADSEPGKQATVSDESNLDSSSKWDLARTQLVAAGSFGVLTIMALLTLAVFIPHPSDYQLEVFRVTTALAAAGVGALLPGFIEVNYQTWLRAGGAFGLFVLVYLVNPSGSVHGGHHYLEVTRVERTDEQDEGEFRLFLDVNGNQLTYPLTEAWSEFGGAQMGRIPLPRADEYKVQFETLINLDADGNTIRLGSSETQRIPVESIDDPVEKEYLSDYVSIKYQIAAGR